MSNNNSWLEKFMSACMSNTKRKLISGSQKREVMKELSRLGSNWKFNSSNFSWDLSLENGKVYAEINSNDLDLDPALTAGFARFHDPEFKEFEWMRQSPGWSERKSKPESLSKVRFSDITNEEIDKLLDQHSWISELDEPPKDK